MSEVIQFDAFFQDKVFDTKHGRAFRKFHKENPQVLRELLSRLRPLYLRGHKRVGLQMLFEDMRYDYMMRTTGDDEGFKLNNNYVAYYTRLIRYLDPDVGSIITSRKSDADNEDLDKSVNPE